MTNGISFPLPPGCHLLIAGDNASGKTVFVEGLVRRYPSSTGYIMFRDSYGEADPNYYIQLRWNRQAIDEDTPTVGAFIRKAIQNAEGRDRWLAPDIREQRVRLRGEMLARLEEMFSLSALYGRFVISLSSGESRKLQLAKALLSLPQTLVLDNPFIGLDAASRDEFSAFLTQLAASTHIGIVMIAARIDSIPDFITHVAIMRDGEIASLIPVDEVTADLSEKSAMTHFSGLGGIPIKDLSADNFYPQIRNSTIIECRDVSIRYGEKHILRHFNWTVREGERWSLTGPNGSGKSTLLSLVCADNPQAYACDISLFGHKRGGGESIWDIKKHIGYVCPEMHRACRSDVSALELVANGLFDTTGMYRTASETQLSTAMEWMRVFEISHIAARPYLKLSSGEQRLCLLARAFVKDPELLVLDEPFHGLDASRSRLARRIIDEFVARPHKTMIMVSHFQEDFPSCIDHNLNLSVVQG